MSLEQTTAERENRKDKFGSYSQADTIVFPSDLQLDQEGANFVHFRINRRQAGESPQPVNVFLYVPIGFSLGDSANYGDMELGAIVGAAETVKTLLGGSGLGGTNFTGADMLGTGLLASGMAQGLLGDVGAFLTKGTQIEAMRKGVAINQNIRTQFQGTQIRSFSFDFKIVPSNPEESTAMRQLEKTFRRYLYPKKAGQIALYYPPEFQITFYNSNEDTPNPYMPILMPAYLTGVTANYNPTSNMTFKDGAPVELDLQLQFQEKKQLVRDDFDDPDADEYGFVPGIENTEGAGETAKNEVNKPVGS